MTTRLIATRLMIATMVAMPAAASAQDWVPGTEIAGQSIVVETNGVANTIYFDAGGAARIVSPSGAGWSTPAGPRAGIICASTPVLRPNAGPMRRRSRPASG